MSRPATGKRPRRDWCRNGDWTPLAREKFFLRLAMVRNHMKYLRRKAEYILDAHPEGALELLQLAAGEAHELAERVGTRREIARALGLLGRPHDATAAWREALACAGEDAMRVETAVELAAYIAGQQRIDDYAEAAAALDGLDGQLLDPVQRFLYFAALALLADARHDAAQAKLDARSAFCAHHLFATGPRNFPEAGLSGSSATGLYTRLFALAGDDRAAALLPPTH